MEIEEVGVAPLRSKEIENPDAWETIISKEGRGGAFVYLDSSLLDSEGNVGGGAFVVGADGTER